MGRAAVVSAANQRDPNAAPFRSEVLLWRLEDLIRQAAVKGDRLPPIADITYEIDANSESDVYCLLAAGEKKRLWRIVRTHSTFVEVHAVDGSWRTATWEEWHAKQRVPDRRCLSCRKVFAPPSRFRFMCDWCVEHA